MNIPKTANTWRFILFVALVSLAPLSKYPSISLPLYNFTSFRIGLYQVIAALFILLCLKPLYKSGINYFKSSHPVALYSIITLLILVAFGLFRSIYIQRGLLMSVSFVMILLVLISAWWFAGHEFTENRKKIILKYMLIAAIAYGVVAFIQLLVFTLTNQTLGVLCAGCTAEIFGFPRVNGLAAEPQFFANAIIPFVFAGLYSVIKKNSLLGWASLIFSVFTIGLTFSRGAYAALAISLAGVGVALLIRKFTTFKRIVLIYSVIVAAILMSFGALILSASVRYDDSPNIAYETLDSITEHLTLGIIDLPESQLIIIPAQEIPQSTPDNNFVSPGLIEASNQERTSAAELAIKAWSSTIITVITGVGLGNLGPYVVNNIDISAPENLTVYIFYILFLAELGILGLVALVLIFGTAIISLAKYNSLEATIINGRLAAFALQFLFFGSYINVVYIWLWVGIALGLTGVIPAVNLKKRYTKQ